MCQLKLKYPSGHWWSMRFEAEASSPVSVQAAR